MLNENDFYMFKHGKDIGVCSCESAYNKIFWIYSGSRRHFILIPCYCDLNDSNTLEWRLIHRPIDNNDD